VFQILMSAKKIQTTATRHAKTLILRGVSATRYAKTFREISNVVVPWGTKVMGGQMGQRAVL
jgi:hypothetical protein